jgi:opacity protein-like surface antigen
MKNGTIIAIAALVLVLVLVLPTAAGAAEQEMTLGVRFGLAIDDSTFGGLPFEITPNAGSTYGLRLGFRQGHLGVEVGYAYVGRTLTPVAEAPSEVVETAFHMGSLSFNVIYYPLPSATLQPYLTGGYGFYRLNFEAYGEDSNSGFNAGAGLNLLVLRRLSLSLEGRYHWVDFAVEGQTLDVKNWMATLGLNYHF